MANLSIKDASANTQVLKGTGAGSSADPLVVEHGLPPSSATPIAAGAGSVQGVAAAAGLRLCGFMIRETTGGGAAQVTLRHGTTAGDPQLATQRNVASAGMDFVWFGEGGVSCANGIYVQRNSGTTEIVLYSRLAP